MSASFADTSYFLALLNRADALHDALTADHHFVQAGFRASMLEP